MTTPYERTKEVLATWDFLHLLAEAEEVTIPGPVQFVAFGVFRAYPNSIDLSLSASVLPEIWATPPHI
jgi:hypothetical protein